MIAVPSGSPASAFYKSSYVFTPTTGNQAISSALTLTNGPNSTATHLSFNGTVTQGTETDNARPLLQHTRIKSISAYIVTALTGSDTVVLTLMVNGIASPLTCTLSSSGNTCTASTDVVIQDSDLVSIKVQRNLGATFSNNGLGISYVYESGISQIHGSTIQGATIN